MAQGLLEGSKDHGHVERRAVAPHESNTPHLACRRPEPASNLKGKLVHNVLAHLGSVHASRHADCGDGGEAVLGVWHEQLKTKGLKTRVQQLGILSMPAEHAIKTLLSDDSKSLTESIEVGDRASVVVGAGRIVEDTPVSAHKVKIEVVRLDLGLAVLKLLHRSGRHSERRGARWAAEALLAARVADVNTPFIDEERYATQSAHGINKQKAASLLAGLANALKRLESTSRALTVHKEEYLGLVLGKRSLDLFKGESLTRLGTDFLGDTVEATNKIRHSLTPNAVDAHYNNVVRFHKVRNCTLHGGMTSS
eukprot:Colp12_sorted_trinity150504_noHs@2281